MKEVYAIIRPEKDRQTKIALAKLGLAACTTLRVLGRGRQGGLQYNHQGNGKSSNLFSHGMKYLSKKLIYLVVDDDSLDLVVETLIRINQTGGYGDGKIFVCDVENAVRIRTGEESLAAIGQT